MTLETFVLPLSTVLLCVCATKVYGAMDEVRDALDGLEEELSKLKDSLAKLGPFSGFGLFTVERSTLTSSAVMISEI